MDSTGRFYNLIFYFSNFCEKVLAMRFIKSDINIDFIGKRKIAFSISIAMILISIFSLILHRGPKYGIDFAGGTVIQIKFSEPVKISDIKTGLEKVDLGISSVQFFGAKADNEYLIRTDRSAVSSQGISNAVSDALKLSTGKDVEIRRIEMVGPQVGKDLREKALFAMFYALLFITIYISGRFELKWFTSGGMTVALIGAVYVLSLFNVSIPFLMTAALIVALVLFWLLDLKYAMGAIVALIHDVTITVGIFSIFDKEFTLPIVAALLTIIGYSLNDTIIVFDRIRENSRKYHKNPLYYIINRSVNETLSRTILTSLTTLIVVVCLFSLGGGIIHDFAFAMIVGVLVGTYSSIYVASPIIVALQQRRR
jgi:preprotein translocase subunit SecF